MNLPGLICFGLAFASAMLLSCIEAATPCNEQSLGPFAGKQFWPQTMLSEAIENKR